MHFYLIFLSFIWISCAKVGYVTEQGIGQVSLEWNGEDNEKILMDPDVKEEHKGKIRKIEAYKEFFYNYFNREQTPIYSETTMLDSEAVTYLVIASKKTIIEPLMVSFPIVGEFPYLGFFKKKSAKSYERKLEKDGFATYIRPVYAYSTLNKLPFYDNILSSFFVYSDQDLAELIFHELTHTVFFVKDEVEFNESFAEYIGRELSYKYFNYSSNDMLQIDRRKKGKHKLMEHIALKSNELNKLYKNEKRLSESIAEKILEEFVKTDFEPSVKKLCMNLKLKKCWPLNGTWNNAKFAAFMTYTKEQKLIATIHNKKKVNLKKFLEHIEKRYEEFKDSGDKSFVKFLKKKENL